MAPKLSNVSHEFARMGSTASCWIWSIGHVTPLSKSGSPNLIPGEYCLTSITLVLSNVFHCLLAKHCTMHLLKHDSLPSLQFGFRKGMGTCNAFLTITSGVQKSLDTGCEVHMIGLDFSAAFDHVIPYL